MRSIWFCFKLVEGCLGCLCMGIQIEGFLNVAVSQDLYVYITIFSVFTCISFFGCLNICMDHDPTLVSEMIWNGFACFGYTLTAILTMYHAEKDLYLIHLKGVEIIEEAAEHPFFGYSKFQAITGIVTGVVHLMHAVLAGDVVFVEADRRSGEKPRIILYLGGLWFHTHLMKFKWFRRFEGPNLSARTG
ncbi:uncharacterized protein LOC129237835 [Anastrepha obliqua]|uniref:uncharacterized protein LOC129237835 n=1 Tax=Anastrepha obliqua TaxID=95512 RepID=UPI00240A40BD|nr:uncharacterized protein LOC129237835 [Anastrepha obliqua]